MILTGVYMKIHDRIKIKKLNELVSGLKMAIDQYNQFTRPVSELTMRLRTSGIHKEKSGKTRRNEDLVKQYELLIRRLGTSDFKNIEGKVKKLTEQIQKLEIEIYGKSHTGSPGFLMKRK